MKGQAKTTVWPTPTTRDYKDTGRLEKLAEMIDKNHLTLPRAVAREELKKYPTPRACSAMAATITSGAYSDLGNRFPNLETVVAQMEGPSSIGCVMNPEFVEFLQGFPIMWTDLKPSGTL